MNATHRYPTGTRVLAALLLAACVFSAAPAFAKQVKLDVAMGHPVVLADEKQTAYLRVAMTGFELEDPEARTPVNVAIVLDKSGSMQGQKLDRAKEAAIMAIGRLRKDDIVSVIAYDTTVHVLVPATRVSDREQVIARIRQLQANGSTALFAGVSKAAKEIRKFISKNRVNRIVLLSDGIANVGPSSPGDLAELGSSLIREGIAVTTIGLGLNYNEDLMTQLAEKSDGNHMFAENATDLARAFDEEFGDVLSVVAQEVTVAIRTINGVRPVRVLGREAQISGASVITTLNQLYSEQEKYVLVEVELPAGNPGTQMQVASVDLSYANMGTKTTDKLRSTVAVNFSNSPADVEKKANAAVMTAVVEQIGVERSQLAVKLRDEGKVEQAAQAFSSNAMFLNTNAEKYGSQRLREFGSSNIAVSVQLEGEHWKAGRKMMRKDQYHLKNQQVQSPQK
jgi:Ca-activated chloride channel homolog